MSLENPYAYSGNKRSRQDLPPADRLANPVAFTAGELNLNPLDTEETSEA